MHEIDLMLKFQLEGKNQEARKLSDKLEQIGPTRILDSNGKNTEDIWNRHCFNRGWFMLQEGNYQLGSKLCEYGRVLNTYGSSQAATTKPLYNPEQHDIRDKILIINLEGGYGDEIIHARFAQTFKEQGAKKVYLAAAPEMIDLFGSVTGVDQVIRRDEYSKYQHDFWLPAFSAGWLAGHTFESIPNDPYIFAKKDLVSVWSNIIKSDRIKVGIRWAGNPKFEHQQFRRFPENFLFNLSQYPELQLYSLQRDNNILNLPDNIIDLQHLLLSWDDTAAAIENLDIVISSCTSVAHLAAAMGKKTYVMVPILPYHTWCYRSPESDTSPYYKTVKLFRQTDKSKWNLSFQKMYRSLEQELNLEKKELPNEDRTYSKLNLGCKHNKIEGCINVDSSLLYNPDLQIDFGQKPWPFKENEFIHIVALNCLTRIAKDSEDLIAVLKEMYRISETGAVWEIQFNHYTSFIDYDFEQNFKISLGHLYNLSQKDMLSRIQNNTDYNLIPFEQDIDIQILDVVHEYPEQIKAAVQNQTLSPELLKQHEMHMNNVIKKTRVLMEVHKPGRITEKELIDELAKLQLKSVSQLQ